MERRCDEQSIAECKRKRMNKLRILKEDAEIDHLESGILFDETHNVYLLHSR
jgi:hypothetical protein